MRREIGMRRLLVATLALGATAYAGSALACADCGDYEYVPARAYMDYSSMTPEQQRLADIKARQDAETKAMDEARATLMARFSIVPDPDPAPTADVAAAGQPESPGAP
jgi:hypothetical protein